MNKVSWQEYQLSRLMLGTVQFGMPYGVGNQTGQPNYEDVKAILSVALEGGVNCFDTAAAYGSSEEVLGRALRELSAPDELVVVTKVRVLKPEELADPGLAARAIETSVADSRRKLQLDCLPVVLFHREGDAGYLPELQKLKERGWIKHYGVSCDNRPGSAAEIVKAGQASALQIPGNMLDPRHARSGIFQEAEAEGVAVFLRSVYLQGLLAMPEEKIPVALAAVLPVRRALAQLAAESGMQLHELALRYMLSQTGITCILTGVETVDQIRENIRLFARGPLDDDLLARVEEVIPDLPEEIITPSLWSTATAPHNQSFKR